jgi:hypothetical protein
VGVRLFLFPRVTAHALRHTAASLAISAGANPKVVQRMLGHASAAMTLDVYADLFDSDLESVAEKCVQNASLGSENVLCTGAKRPLNWPYTAVGRRPAVDSVLHGGCDYLRAPGRRHMG